MAGTADGELYQRVFTALQGGNGQMVKRALQYRGLTRGAGDDIAELAQRIVGYVDDGKLAAAEVSKLLREMHEYGAKHVYLLRGKPADMRLVQASALDRPITSLDGARVMLRPTSPRCNYSYADAHQIRLSYSEIHVRPRNLKVGRGRWESQSFETTRVVVIRADLQSGVVVVALDPPAGDHDHGDRPVDYVNHYHTLAGLQLNTTLAPLEWHEQLAAIELEKHRELVTMSTQRGQDRQGLDYVVHCGEADLRDYEGFRSRASTVALRKHAKVTWQKTTGAPTQAMLLSGQAVLKPIKTEIHAAPAMVKFAQHTLPQEMTYVLDTVRSLA